MRYKSLGSLVVALFAATSMMSGVAQAQEPVVPSGTAGTIDPASKGNTELDDQGKFSSAKKAEEDAEAESTDTTEFSISAGGLLSTGNARAAALTGASKFRLRRKIHMFGADLVGNYGAGAPDLDSDLEPNVANVQGRVRYDIFLHERVSAFLMFTGRHDRFQGLAFRLNVDPGFAFYILTKKANQLWAEAGYDFQYDRRTNEALEDNTAAIAANMEAIMEAEMNGETPPDPIAVLDPVFKNHAYRLFLGYSNRMLETISFDTGVEWLHSFIDPAIYRVNWDNNLSVSLASRFSLGITFTLRYENRPLPTVRPLDTITSVNLIYRFI